MNCCTSSTQKPCTFSRNQKFFPGAGRVTQVVKCLPNKLEALSSNPNTATKKKKKLFPLRVS
jgi:hypothetical protein